jgi:hypothetical protein
MALGLAATPAIGCNDEEVDKGFDKATDGVSTAGKEAKDEGGEVKRDVEKEIED